MLFRRRTQEVEEESVTSEGNRAMTFVDFGDIEALADWSREPSRPSTSATVLEASAEVDQCVKGPQKQAKTPPKLKLSQEIGFSIADSAQADGRLEKIWTWDWSITTRQAEKGAARSLADFQVTLSSKPPDAQATIQTDWLADEPRRERTREELETAPSSATWKSAGFTSVGDLLQPSTRVRIT